MLAVLSLFALLTTSDASASDGGPERVAAAETDSMDKIVCRRITRTGSLVAQTRLCKTRREWSRDADRHQSEWGGMQGRQGTGQCPIDPQTDQPLC